jgi:hypothetical protein
MQRATIHLHKDLPPVHFPALIGGTREYRTNLTRRSGCQSITQLEISPMSAPVTQRDFFKTAKVNHVIRDHAALIVWCTGTEKLFFYSTGKI